MSAEEALARAVGAGIRRLSLPTPFMVGPVNVYLIEDEPLTLVDTGPNSGTALDELERGLGALGHRVEDLGLIVLTHQHIDHLGLAGILARRSGAQLAALATLAPYVEHYEESAERDDRFAEAIMRRHGIPGDVVYALRAVSRGFRAWGAAATVTRPVREGERLELRDRTLEILHRPGHSPSDTLLWDEERRILLAGDHLIAHISSNPLLARPLADDAGGGGERPRGHDGGDAARGGRPRALIDYLDSLRATRELPAELVLPGHGEPVSDHVALIDRRLKLHQRRARRILGLIAEQPRSAYEIAQALWGNVAVTQAYLTLSEVLGHVDLLLADERVRELEAHGVVRFAAEAAEGGGAASAPAADR